MPRVALSVCALFTLACGGPDSVAVSPAGGGAWNGVDGWLGLATIDGVGRPYTPRTTAGDVVVPWPEPFAEVPTGADFTAWSSGAVIPLSFAGVQDIAMGCDETPTAMAVFTSEAVFPEGLVWITAGDHHEVQVHPAREASPPTPATRSWSAGPMTLDLEGADNQGTLEVIKDGRHIGELSFVIPPMDGSETRLDLTQDSVMGAPFPEGTLTIDGRALLFTRSYSREGVRFGVHEVGSRLETLGEPYLYLCAM